MPDFSRLDRRPPRWRRWVIGGGLVILAILAVAAWASFLIFKPYTTTSGGNVILVIEAPEETAIGSELTYRITLTNDDRIPLARSVLEVRPPDHFALVDASPIPDDARDLRWTIGTLPANGTATIELRGRLYGSPSSAAHVSATVLYRPANFNADFQTRGDATTKLGTSPLTLTIDGPERAVPGEEIRYHITYTYNGAEMAPATVLTLEAPRTFALRTAEPPRARDDELLWNLGELAPAAHGDITLVGTFQTGAKEPFTLSARATMQPTGDEQLPLAEETIATRVIGGDVMLIATVNDQTTGFTAHPGDALHIRITVRNDGDDELRSLSAAVMFEATSVAEQSILNFAAIDDPRGGTAVGEQLAAGLRRGTITWTPEHIPALASIQPGEQQQIDLSIPLHTLDSLPGLPAHGTVIISATVTIEQTGDVAQSRHITSTPITLIVR